ncbi:MAG: SEC-C domain-containing protein [Lutibacter sp.]|nr:SEC-C domain-containing protein [Lutibacter sp.]MBP9601365.1 SEC-C domain-containing protein [Lutibacter sp.]
MNQKECPCGSGKTYENCCEIAHKNILNVITAEALMRSRYSAFVLANMDYLKKSWHSSNKPSKNEIKEIVAWTQSVIWHKLEILSTSKGLKNDNEGYVEFKAYYYEGFILNNIHENSFFVKENGHWVYQQV